MNTITTIIIIIIIIIIFGVSQRPLTLILPQKYRDANGRRIVIQIGGVYTTLCQREGILLQKYAIEMGGVSRYIFTCIGVRSRFDSPDHHHHHHHRRRRRHHHHHHHHHHHLAMSKQQCDIMS